MAATARAPMAATAQAYHGCHSTRHPSPPPSWPPHGHSTKWWRCPHCGAIATTACQCPLCQWPCGWACHGCHRPPWPPQHATTMATWWHAPQWPPQRATPTGMLPWLPAPWCTVPCTNLGGTMQWLLQHAPHGPTMAATARPHHGCHSTPPAAMAACTWPPWAATWCGQCCPPTPLPWLPKHAPSVGRVGTAALGAQITPFLQTSWCS